VKNKTVYVVDDDSAVRIALTRSIGLRGYKIHVFETAEEFLEKVDVQYPCCLILDVRMPGMTGLELQDRILQSNFLIPIIFITGHGDIPMSVGAIQKGAVDFLEKPYLVDTLLERIETAMQLSTDWHEESETRRAIVTRYQSLTAREQDVFKLLVAGAADASNKEIARDLAISHRTVDDHRARIMAKMRARSLTELVEMAKTCQMHDPT